jgi:hypothetical protein
MSTFNYEQEKVYIDKAVMDENELTIQQVQYMVNAEPEKYVLSQYVKRLLNRQANISR